MSAGVSDTPGGEFRHLAERDGPLDGALVQVVRSKGGPHKPARRDLLVAAGEQEGICPPFARPPCLVPLSPKVHIPGHDFLPRGTFWSTPPPVGKRTLQGRFPPARLLHPGGSFSLALARPKPSHERENQNHPSPRRSPASRWSARDGGTRTNIQRKETCISDTGSPGSFLDEKMLSGAFWLKSVAGQHTVREEDVVRSDR